MNEAKKINNQSLSPDLPESDVPMRYVDWSSACSITPHSLSDKPRRSLLHDCYYLKVVILNITRFLTSK